jgi:protein arginine N-methyltransferase 1
MNEYSIRAYGEMTIDRGRVAAYLAAMRQAIDETSVVLDLGTGTGFFALWACRLGARRVYAVDPTDLIQVARQLAAENDCRDRIVFFQDLSTNVALPERVDVIVSDLRSILPLHTRHLRSIADARERFLAPGGRLIPQRDSLWLAVAETPEKYDRLTRPWSSEQHGWRMQAARRLATNGLSKCRVLPGQLLTEPACWGNLDYTSAATPHCEGDVRIRATRRGTAHGLCLWFDSVLAPGVCLSNAPDKEEMIYGQAFFPFSEPIDLDEGDDISVSVKARLVGNDYVWSWETRVFDRNDPRRARAHSRQSTFYGAPVSLDSLRRRSADHVPKLNSQGRMTRFVLESMDSDLSNGRIARQLFERFPADFPDLDAAESYVNDLAVQFSVPG